MKKRISFYDICLCSHNSGEHSGVYERDKKSHWKTYIVGFSVCQSEEKRNITGWCECNKFTEKTDLNIKLKKEVLKAKIEEFESDIREAKYNIEEFKEETNKLQKELKGLKK